MIDRNKILNSIDNKRKLFGLFFAFGNRLQTAGDAFYEEITCKQFFLLICMFLFEKPPTLSELSEVMGSSHQNVKQIVNKLERDGFLTTYPDEKDARKLRVTTNDKFALLSKKYEAKEIKFINKFYEGVSDDDIASTLNTVLKIENNLVRLREEYK
jgi:DNA-binding MarR family transcriptional regulator